MGGAGFYVFMLLYYTVYHICYVTWYYIMLHFLSIFREIFVKSLTSQSTYGIIVISTRARKGGTIFRLAEWKGGLRNPNGQEVGYMTIFETLYLMLQTGFIVIALITLIVVLIIHITNNEKK